MLEAQRSHLRSLLTDPLTSKVLGASGLALLCLYAGFALTPVVSAAAIVSLMGSIGGNVLASQVQKLFEVLWDQPGRSEQQRLAAMAEVLQHKMTAVPGLAEDLTRFLDGSGAYEVAIEFVKENPVHSHLLIGIADSLARTAQESRSNRESDLGFQVRVLETLSVVIDALRELNIVELAPKVYATSTALNALVLEYRQNRISDQDFQRRLNVVANTTQSMLALLPETLNHGFANVRDTIVIQGVSIKEDLRSESASLHADISDIRNAIDRLLSVDNEQTARLRAMQYDHSSFLRSRLENFVGRIDELAEIRNRIALAQEDGGYVTITGVAGQGKSCIIAKLVHDADPATVAHHFIPFSPGPDHQVGLLRDLMARLIIKYKLPEFYVASDNRTILRDYFANLIAELHRLGKREVIYIDGLDQIERDLNGARDLSFLPLNPPSGIVFVLGTRPDDTLRPLELRKALAEYRLPPLSQHDFEAILSLRNVSLDPALSSRFYSAMQANALYLDLIAQELAQTPDIDPAQVILRITDDPANLFAISIDRLKLGRSDWHVVLRPLIAVLLTLQEPIDVANLWQILRVEFDAVKDGLRHLGGLINFDGQNRPYLYHRKLRDFLLATVFLQEELATWHTKIASWCIGGEPLRIWDTSRDKVDQGRREYARRHYISHLFYSGDYNLLFTVLDTGEYGRAKLTLDRSTRAYALDLDLGRDAACSDTVGFDEALRLLPHLWRYSLLRCSLASGADSYPLAIFRAFILLDRAQDAIGLAELMTSPSHKAETLAYISHLLDRRVGREAEAESLLIRAYEVFSIDGEFDWDKLETLIEYSNLLKPEVLHAVYTTIQRLESQERRSEFGISRVKVKLVAKLVELHDFVQAERIARTIVSYAEKARALGEVSVGLTKIGHLERALELLAEAEQLARLVKEDKTKAYALGHVAELFMRAEQWIDAERVARSIVDPGWQSLELDYLVEGLIDTRQWTEAQRVISTIEKGGNQVYQLGNFTVALTAAGQTEQAFQLIVEAEHLIRSSEDNNSLAYSLRELATALAEMGHKQRARDILLEAEQYAYEITDEHRHTSALIGLARKLIHLCEWVAAKRVILAITDYQQQELQLRNLSTALANAKQWSEAERVAYSIRSIHQCATALGYLSAELAESGQRVWAVDLLAKAEMVARIGARARGQAKALRELAETLAMVQQWSEAEKVVLAIDDIYEQAKALTRIAELQMTAAQKDAALHTLAQVEHVTHEMPSDYRRAYALRDLGKAFVLAEQWFEAERVIRTIEVVDQRAYSLRLLASDLAASEKWSEAERVANSIDFPTSRGNAMEWHHRDFAKLELAKALVVTKNWTEVKRIAYSIEYAQALALALVNLSEALAEADKWVEADQIARSIEPVGKRSVALGAIAGVLSKKGQQELALQLLREAEQTAFAIVVPHQRSDALADLVASLARTGWWTEAERVARAIEPIKDHERRGVALRSLAKELAKAHLWSEAERIAWSIDDEWRKYALIDFLEILDQDGQYEYVESIVRSIEDVEHDSYVLKRAAKILTRVFIRTGRWTDAEHAASSIDNGTGFDYHSVGLSDGTRVAISHQLMIQLAQSGHIREMVGIVQRGWRQASTREAALNFLPLAGHLAAHSDTIISELINGNAWVENNQLHSS